MRFGPKQYGYTASSCSAACKGYNYFSLQDHRGWCSCENDLSHATKYGVSNDCPDNQMGGTWANDIFQNSDDAAAAAMKTEEAELIDNNFYVWPKDKSSTIEPLFVGALFIAALVLCICNSFVWMNLRNKRTKAVYGFEAAKVVSDVEVGDENEDENL